MSLSREDVLKIAKLGRLSLNEDEIAKLSQDLGKILDYIGTLQELDTSHTDPMVGALEFTHVLRRDELEASSSEEIEAMLANAPDTERTYIKIPRMTKAKS